jgi:plasmid stability protein
MNQLNVRNVDDDLWRELKQRAVQSGTSVGELLNRILSDWLGRQDTAPADARERARRGRGILSEVPQSVSLTEQLHSLRQADVERESQR